jgi:hypothetical protein
MAGRGERRDPQFDTERHIHHTVGVMIWSAIAYGSRSPVVFIGSTMTARRYIQEVVEPYVLPYLETIENPLFQQDNARPHVALDFMDRHHINRLPWPPRTCVGRHRSQIVELTTSS